eukprot:ctg_740.g172
MRTIRGEGGVCGTNSGTAQKSEGNGGSVKDIANTRMRCVGHCHLVATLMALHSPVGVPRRGRGSGARPPAVPSAGNLVNSFRWMPGVAAKIFPTVHEKPMRRLNE